MHIVDEANIIYRFVGDSDKIFGNMCVINVNIFADIFLDRTLSLTRVWLWSVSGISRVSLRSLSGLSSALLCSLMKHLSLNK